MPIEGLHTETGPGVLEAAIAVDEALEAADKAALFKTFAKVLAQRRGWMATFMAKWSKDWPGQSGHIHVSLQTKSGKSAFYDAKGTHRMSRTMRRFVGGQQALMPELLAMVAPTVNSYRRLIPGFWAPTEPPGASRTAPARCASFPAPQIPAGRVPDRRRRRQPLHRARRSHRLGPLGHREQGLSWGRRSRETQTRRRCRRGSVSPPPCGTPPSG